jgi:hypothetical protein
MTIHVHIDRLILDGLPTHRAQRAAVGAALQAELRRLLITDGLGPGLLAGGVLEHLRGDDLRHDTAASAASLGSHIAEAVHRGMRR